MTQMEQQFHSGRIHFSKKLDKIIQLTHPTSVKRGKTAKPVSKQRPITSKSFSYKPAISIPPQTVIEREQPLYPNFIEGPSRENTPTAKNDTHYVSASNNIVADNSLLQNSTPYQTQTDFGIDRTVFETDIIGQQDQDLQDSPPHPIIFKPNQFYRYQDKQQISEVQYLNNPFNYQNQINLKNYGQKSLQITADLNSKKHVKHRAQSVKYPKSSYNDYSRLTEREKMNEYHTINPLIQSSNFYKSRAFKTIDTQEVKKQKNVDYLYSKNDHFRTKKQTRPYELLNTTDLSSMRHITASAATYTTVDSNLITVVKPIYRQLAKESVTQQIYEESIKIPPKKSKLNRWSLKIPRYF